MQSRTVHSGFFFFLILRTSFGMTTFFTCLSLPFSFFLSLSSSLFHFFFLFLSFSSLAHSLKYRNSYFAFVDPVHVSFEKEYSGKKELQREDFGRKRKWEKGRKRKKERKEERMGKIKQEDRFPLSPSISLDPSSSFSLSLLLFLSLFLWDEQGKRRIWREKAKEEGRKRFPLPLTGHRIKICSLEDVTWWCNEEEEEEKRERKKKIFFRKREMDRKVGMDFDGRNILMGRESSFSDRKKIELSLSFLSLKSREMEREREEERKKFLLENRKNTLWVLRTSEPSQSFISPHSSFLLSFSLRMTEKGRNERKWKNEEKRKNKWVRKKPKDEDGDNSRTFLLAWFQFIKFGKAQGNTMFFLICVFLFHFQRKRKEKKQEKESEKEREKRGERRERKRKKRNRREKLP